MKKNPTNSLAYELGYSHGNDPTGMAAHHSARPTEYDSPAFLSAYMRGFKAGEQALRNERERLTHNQRNPARKPKFRGLQIVFYGKDGKQTGTMTPEQFRVGVGAPSQMFLEEVIKKYNASRSGDRAEIGMRVNPRRNPGELLTYKQWREKDIKRQIKEYNVPRAEIEEYFGDRSITWIAEVKQALVDGAIPSQSWINALNALYDENDWTWWKSFLHAEPLVADRLTKAGRMVFMTKKKSEAPRDETRREPNSFSTARAMGYADGAGAERPAGWPSNEDLQENGPTVRYYLAGYQEGEAYKKKHGVRKNPRRNPVPKSAPSRALLCIGQLRKLEVVGKPAISCSGKWLAWDGKRFHICTVQGQVNATLPTAVTQKHKKFHQANPQGKPFLASMPSPGPGLRDVGLLKSLVYSVPSKINSPGKNKYLWHHAFGDTGHKGGDSYPTKVMPMLQRDNNGNLFIKRRKGNIFKVDQWLRG